MALRPVTRRSVSDEVFDQLSAEIVSGAIAAGEPLPAERALTVLLGVNRQAVREALKRLHQAGLVDIQHGGSTLVRDFRTTAGLDLLPHLLGHPDGSFDPTVVRSIMEMRSCIGPDAARHCALRALPAAVEELGADVDAMERSIVDLETLGTLDWQFWGRVVDGADNIAYRLAFNSLRASAEPILGAITEVLADELVDVAGHRAIADAIAAGDGARAEAAARALLARGTVGITTVLAALRGSLSSEEAR